MDFFNKMERKLGKFAIRNLTNYIIASYIIGYFIQLVYPQLQIYLSLEPALILQGQVWRIVSWILIPPGSLGILTVVMLFFYYSIGGSLERTWGSFRYNVYILGGILITIIGAIILYLVIGDGVLFLYLRGAGIGFSTYYISMSIFLGYALTYPNHQVLLYFVIPIKVKWLAYLDLAFLAMNVIQGSWVEKVAIVCSLLNVGIFFLLTRRPKNVARKRQFNKAVYQGQATKVTKHKCAVCGRTEADEGNLEFRFCSKCNGNYEYCQDHLFTHEHIR